MKPANSGSSVGIQKVKTREGLPRALREAVRYDTKLLVEQAVDAREIEVAVLGNDEPEASVPGEILPRRDWYDYEAKYVDESTELLVPAPLAEAQVAEARASRSRRSACSKAPGSGASTSCSTATPAAST